MIATATATKPRFPNAVGMQVAKELCAALKPACERLIVAGSLRRRKPDIGDVEILYIAKTELRPDPNDMFATVNGNLVDDVLEKLQAEGVLEFRRNALGSVIYGPKNKLMRHCATGLPVDLFAATPENWFNYLVCRTGPAESNTRICMAAQKKGWKWNPYGPGFTRGGPLAGEPGEFIVRCEADVFEFVGLPYLEPWQRR